MGLQFRKSISIGKFLRINLSKSGIGWSVGTKGIRYSHSATGKTRTTLSIPGTGISYVIPSKKNGDDKKKSASAQKKEAELMSVGDSEAVYYSMSGKCYHYNKMCGGRSYAICASEHEAAEKGKVPCSKCCKTE